MSKFRWIWYNWLKKKPLYEGIIPRIKISEMSEKTNIVPDLINANLNVIEEQVLSRLPEDLFNLSKAGSDAIGETAVALFDGNPADGPQVEAIWRAYVNTHLVDFAAVKASNEAGKIKSEILRNLATALVNPAALTLKALTDEITDDGAQLEEVWKNYLLTGSNLTFILNNTLRPALRLIMSDALASVLVGIAETEVRKILAA